MSPWHRFTQMVHLVALGLWFGTTVMASAAAAVIFPQMKALNPHLPGYAAYEGDHWRLAAGTIAERIFLIGDVIQFACSLLAVVTLAVLVVVYRLPRLAASTVLRVLGLIVAAGALASQLIIVSQSMNRSLTHYRAAAAAGDNAAALQHQAAFNDLHPIASALMATTMVAVLVALAAGAWAAGPSGALRGAVGPPPGRTSQLEEPRLLRRGHQ